MGRRFAYRWYGDGVYLGVRVRRFVIAFQVAWDRLPAKTDRSENGD